MKPSTDDFFAIAAHVRPPLQTPQLQAPAASMACTGASALRIFIPYI
jgi:hypothetical protein